MSWWIALVLLINSCLPSFVPPQYYYTHQVYLQDVAPVRQVPVYLDKAFTQQEQLDLQTAIDQWNFALNGRVVIHVVANDFDMGMSDIHAAMDQHGWIIHKIDQTNPMIPASVTQSDGSIHDTCAWVDKVGGMDMWIIMDRIPETWVFSIAMHEIGHLLGAEHQGNLLMSPVFNMYKYQCVDLETMRQVAGHLDLDMGQVNYCRVED